MKQKGIKTVTLVLLSTILLCAIIAPAAAYNYDGDAAANYAYNNAKNYVPGTAVFKDNGDCTNFVSHSLQAGGWTEVGGWYTSSNAWFYNVPYKYGYSHTWAVADRFFDYLTYGGRASPVSVKYNKHLLQKGDIVQIDYTKDGRWDHSMIVTDKNGDDPLMSYHSVGEPSQTGRRNISLTEIMNNNPNACFLGWRISET
jgi:hypothetical protein